MSYKVLDHTQENVIEISTDYPSDILDKNPGSNMIFGQDMFMSPSKVITKFNHNTLVLGRDNRNLGYEFLATNLYQMNGTYLLPDPSQFCMVHIYPLLEEKGYTIYTLRQSAYKNTLSSYYNPIYFMRNKDDEPDIDAINNFIDIWCGFNTGYPNFNLPYNYSRSVQDACDPLVVIWQLLLLHCLEYTEATQQNLYSICNICQNIVNDFPNSYYDWVDEIRSRDTLCNTLSKALNDISLEEAQDTFAGILFSLTNLTSTYRDQLQTVFKGERNEEGEFVSYEYDDDGRLILDDVNIDLIKILGRKTAVFLPTYDNINNSFLNVLLYAQLSMYAIKRTGGSAYPLFFGIDAKNLFNVPDCIQNLSYLQKFQFSTVIFAASLSAFSTGFFNDRNIFADVAGQCDIITSYADTENTLFEAVVELMPSEELDSLPKSERRRLQKNGVWEYLEDPRSRHFKTLLWLGPNRTLFVGNHYSMHSHPSYSFHYLKNDEIPALLCKPIKEAADVIKVDFSHLPDKEELAEFLGVPSSMIPKAVNMILSRLYTPKKETITQIEPNAFTDAKETITQIKPNAFTDTLSVSVESPITDGVISSSVDGLATTIAETIQPVNENGGIL